MGREAISIDSSPPSAAPSNLQEKVGVCKHCFLTSFRCRKEPSTNGEAQLDITHGVRLQWIPNGNPTLIPSVQEGFQSRAVRGYSTVHNPQSSALVQLPMWALMFCPTQHQGRKLHIFVEGYTHSRSLPLKWTGQRCVSCDSVCKHKETNGQVAYIQTFRNTGQNIFLRICINSMELISCCVMCTLPTKCCFLQVYSQLLIRAWFSKPCGIYVPLHQWITLCWIGCIPPTFCFVAQ